MNPMPLEGQRCGLKWVEGFGVEEGRGQTWHVSGIGVGSVAAWSGCCYCGS